MAEYNTDNILLGIFAQEQVAWRDSVFVNPGNVGLAYDYAQLEGDIDDLRTDPFAEYARIDADAGRFEIAFRRVPFDRDAVLAAIDASGMPHGDATRAMWRLRVDS